MKFNYKGKLTTYLVYSNNSKDIEVGHLSKTELTVCEDEYICSRERERERLPLP